MHYLSQKVFKYLLLDLVRIINSCLSPQVLQYIYIVIRILKKLWLMDSVDSAVVIRQCNGLCNVIGLVRMN
jgi:hypothetical protein